MNKEIKYASEGYQHLKGLWVNKMKCPYCGKEMEKGMIISSEPINFMKEVRFVNRPKKKKGEFNLATPPIGGRSHVDARLCRECRKIVIEY